jgi:hypothetical protein
MSKSGDKSPKAGMVSIEEILAEEIDRAEADDPQAFYEAKLISVRIGRELGFSDAELEEALGIRLKPEDRRS